MKSASIAGLKDQLRQQLLDSKEDPRFATAIEVGYCKTYPLVKIHEWLDQLDRENLSTDEAKWIGTLEQTVKDLFFVWGTDQGKILDKLALYCSKYPQKVLKEGGAVQQQPRDPEFIAKLDKGYCLGFTLLRALGRWIDRQPVDEKAARPRDDTNFIDSVMKLLRDWDPENGLVRDEKRELNKQELADIERFLSLLTFFQKSYYLLNRSQNDFIGALSIIADDKKIPPLASAYRLGGRLTQQETQEILQQILTASQQKDGKEVKEEDQFLEILISSHNHYFSIRKIGSKIEFDDPEISEPIQITEKNMLGFLVFLASKFDENRASPLSFHVIAPEGVKLDLPTADILLKQVRKKPIEPIDKSYCKGLSDLSVAIHANSPESVKYFLENGVKFNLDNESDYQIIAQAIYNQCVQSLEILLKHLTEKACLDKNHVQRLIRIAVVSPAESAAVILKYIPDPEEHEYVIRRAIGQGNPQKLEYLLKKCPVDEKQAESILKCASKELNPVFAKIVIKSADVTPKMLRDNIYSSHTSTSVREFLQLELKRVTQPGLLAPSAPPSPSLPIDSDAIKKKF